MFSTKSNSLFTINKLAKKAFTMRSIQIVVMMLLSSVYTNHVSAENYLVRDIAGYEKVLPNLVAGDTVTLKDGVWRDFEILFEGMGTLEKPISLQAETKGEVILSGNSNLRLAGEHLVVSGLVFKNGFTPTSSVISFAKSKTELANHSRVTETVIDAYNNPERFENESWVTMYGRHNRFDHNHISGKSTKGVTMAVRLNTEASQQNYHRIDHNYFGPRSILGSNGGETLRVGTSHYSLTDSFTTVENNYFDRCDGELEIISNNSGNNKYIGNVFYESRGTLTMRHGNDTLIENNVFFGNGADHTGGIRLINKRQTIRNNYMEGLKGYRFGGAMVVMNGVPDSPINRYHQVEDSVIENNSIVNSDHIQLAAGSDFERSAIPIGTSFANNLIYHENKTDPFTIYDDISGIAFAGNAINGMQEIQITDGFENNAFDVKRAENGLLYSTAKGASSSVGIAKDISPITKQQVGPDWYPKSAAQARFDYGNKISVKPGLDTLPDALKEAQDGDILVLSTGEYSVSRVLNLTKAITIQAKSSASNVELNYQRGALFELQEGGSLKLKGLKISGSESPDSSGNTVIRTQRRSMLTNYDLLIEDCEIIDLDINHSFSFLTVSKSTFADRIEITNSTFKNITGAILGLDKESDDFGIYNSEYVTIKDSSFENIGGDIVDYYRGGTDESTFGPHFEMTGSTLSNVGLDKRNKSKSAVLLHGVQVTSMSDNQITASAGIIVNHTVSEPVTSIVNNQFTDTPQIVVSELYSDKTDTATVSGNSYSKTN